MRESLRLDSRSSRRRRCRRQGLAIGLLDRQRQSPTVAPKHTGNHARVVGASAKHRFDDRGDGARGSPLNLRQNVSVSHADAQSGGTNEPQTSWARAGCRNRHGPGHRTTRRQTQNRLGRNENAPVRLGRTRSAGLCSTLDRRLSAGHDGLLRRGSCGDRFRLCCSFDQRRGGSPARERRQVAERRGGVAAERAPQHVGCAVASEGQPRRDCDEQEGGKRAQAADHDRDCITRPATDDPITRAPGY